MKKLFSLDPTASRDMILITLYEKIAQVKAIVECLLLAILSKELENQLLYDAVRVVDSYLEQIEDLHARLEVATV